MRSELKHVLRALPLPLKFFSVLWLLLSVYWQWRVHAPGILGDMWDMFSAYRQLGDMDTPAFLHELLRKYAAVHVLLVPKFFFWLNFHFFAASGVLLKACSFFLCLLNLFLSLSLLLPAVKAVKHEQWFLLALVVLFNGLQTLVIEWDFLLQHYFAVFFSLLAFRVATLSAVVLSLKTLLLACVLLLLAGLSCGSGLASLLAFAFLLLCRRERWQILLAYGLFVLPVSLLLKPDAIPDDAHLQVNGFFWSAPDLLLRYLSFPFSAWSSGFRWLGLLPALVFLFAVWGCLKYRAVSLCDVLLVYFMLIALTVMWGRYRFLGADADLSRYYVYIAPLWLMTLLKLSGMSVLLFRTLSLVCGLGLVCAGLSAVAVGADHAGRMELASVVARNGNFAHLAGLRLNAMVGSERSLQINSDYLKAQHLDIYHVDALPLLAAVEGRDCSATLLRRTAVTKGAYVDYVLRARDANGAALQGFVAVDAQGEMYAGAAVPARVRFKGWSTPLRDIAWADWMLLLPQPWLPATQVLLYTHLPADVRLHDLQLWGQNNDGERCRIQLDAAVAVSAAPE